MTYYTARQAALKRLIDAEGLANGTPVEVLEALTTSKQTGTQRVTIADLQNLLTARGRALAVASLISAPPAGAEALAAFVNMFLNGKQDDFNPLDSSSDTLFGALMVVGVLDSADVGAVKDLARVTSTPAEQVGLAGLTVDEITTVMAMDI